METEASLTRIFLTQVCGIDGLSAVQKGKGMILIPPKAKYFYMPKIQIQDRDCLEVALREYLLAVSNTPIRFTKMDAKHDVSYYLGILTKNLTNADYEHFERYVEIFTQFILDDTFQEYDEKTLIGVMDGEYSLFVRRYSEFYGSETPYAFKMWKKDNHMEYELPLIRYGIYQNKRGEKIARIFMVQRKKLYRDNAFVRRMNKSFSPINSGVKEYRDITPSMVACMTIFIGMLHQEGIRRIEVADFIPRRYMHFKGVTTEQQRDNIQFHATDKYLRLFLRLNNHLEGLDILAYPNDINSFMHIRMQDKITSRSKGLNPYLELGLHSKELACEKKLVKSYNSN